MKDAMKQGRADLIATVHSTVLDPDLQAVSRPLFYLRDGMGITSILFRVARAPFIAANRAALVDYFEDEDRALHWYLDSANHAKAVQIAAAFNKNSPAVYDSWLFTKDDIFAIPTTCRTSRRCKAISKPRKLPAFSTSISMWRNSPIRVLSKTRQNG